MCNTEDYIEPATSTTNFVQIVGCSPLHLWKHSQQLSHLICKHKWKRDLTLSHVAYRKLGKYIFLSCTFNANDCDLCAVDCTYIYFWVPYFRNPNAPHRQIYLTHQDLEWPEYDVSNQTYLGLGK